MTPLWVISLFLSLTEAVLGIATIRTTGGVQVALVAFVISFPIAVAAAFFMILWSRPHVLYAPGDYGDVRPSEFVTALQNAQPPGTLFANISETLQASVSSNQMVAEMLQQMNLPRDRETERRVEALLDEVAERAVEGIRDSSFIEVDAGPMTGQSTNWTLPYDGRSVDAFLDELWYALRHAIKVPAYTYASRWVLRNAKTGEYLTEMGSTWAEKHGMASDDRPLAKVGIHPGDRLRAVWLDSQNRPSTVRNR